MVGKDEVWFVYDGECPLCQLGASFYKIRKSVGTLHLIDARKDLDHPIMEEIKRARRNLDDGMVIKFRQRLYQGEHALHMMARLGSRRGILNKINNYLFRWRLMARASYPFMKAGRSVALRLKGARKINNLRE